MNQSKFEKLVNEIPRLFTDRHAHIIYGLIRWLKAQNIVEVGCFHGYITSWLAKAVDDNGGGTVIAIDNFSLLNDPVHLHNNLSELGLANNVTIIPIDSQQMTHFPNCDLAFIDGNHGLEGVTTDFQKANDAGAKCIILHDSQSWWGVNDFVANRAYWSACGFDMIEVDFDEGLAIFMKQLPDVNKVIYTKEEYPLGYIPNQ